MPSCALAVVTYTGHFAILHQFLLSIAAHLLDPAACQYLLLTSTPTESAKLGTLLNGSAAPLAPLLPRLTITDLPHAASQLTPGLRSSFPAGKNVGHFGRLYVCAKKAYAVRYAHEVLGVEHVILTDSEAYVWKRFSIARLFRSVAEQPSVWFSDAPVHHRRGGNRQAAPSSAAASSSAAAASAAAASSAASASVASGTSVRLERSLKWCSLHVFGDARRWTADELAARVPSPGAALFEDMLFSYPRAPFRAYWAAVEDAWAPGGSGLWFDGLVAAFKAEPACLSIGYWLEVSWNLFLHVGGRS